MNKNDTILKMQSKINEIETYVATKLENVDEETKEKVIKIKNRTVDVINTAINKVEETANEVSDDAYLGDFLTKVETKCEEATKFTISKIDEVLMTVSQEEKIKAASKQVQDAFDELTNNDEVKEVISSIKEVANSMYVQIEEYLAKPETQETIKKAKKTTIKVAEKGLDALKNLLNVEEDSTNE